VRYAARDNTVFAFVRDARDTVTLPDVSATPTTSVTTVDGSALPWKDSPEGLVVDATAVSARTGPDPTVVALHQVSGRGHW
jgi:hypothetical protein